MDDEARGTGENAGRFAATPWAIPGAGWKAVLKRSWREASDDNIGIVAAGVSFYGFLAFVPLLGAIVLTYGLVAEPTTVIHNVREMASVMPADAAKLIGEQLMSLVKTSSGKKGAGVLLALAIALFGARNGAGSLITALNIAYEERETRGFLRVNLLALAITACSVLVASMAMVAIAALGHLDDLLPLSSDVILALGKILSYLLFLLAGAAGAATLYRFGPARRKPRWVWLTPGSVFTAVSWLVLTAGFGLYVARFGNYDATYGSLGAVVVMLTWLYLSSYVLLFGAEVNSELEKQTMVDTTSGPARPMGERGAWVADHVDTQTVARGQDMKAGDAFILPAMTGARLCARGLHILGGPKVGLVASATATMGLARIKRRGSFGTAVAFLGAAALITWLGRDPKTRRQSAVATGRRKSHSREGAAGRLAAAPIDDGVQPDVPGR